MLQRTKIQDSEPMPTNKQMTAANNRTIPLNPLLPPIMLATKAKRNQIRDAVKNAILMDVSKKGRSLNDAEIQTHVKEQSKHTKSKSVRQYIEYKCLQQNQRLDALIQRAIDPTLTSLPSVLMRKESGLDGLVVAVPSNMKNEDKENVPPPVFLYLIPSSIPTEDLQQFKSDGMRLPNSTLRGDGSLLSKCQDDGRIELAIDLSCSCSNERRYVVIKRFVSKTGSGDAKTLESSNHQFLSQQDVKHSATAEALGVVHEDSSESSLVSLTNKGASRSYKSGGKTVTVTTSSKTVRKKAKKASKPFETRIVTPLGNNQRIESYYQEKLDDTQKLRFIRELILGLMELHDAGIYHMDIKPENVILANSQSCGSNKKDANEMKFAPVFCDFGYSTHEKYVESSRGTVDWMAPELASGFDGEALGKVSSRETDIYSLGLVVLFLDGTYKDDLFPVVVRNRGVGTYVRNLNDQRRRVIEEGCLGGESPSSLESVRRAMFQMSNPKPESRMSLKEALSVVDDSIEKVNSRS